MRMLIFHLPHFNLLFVKVFSHLYYFLAENIFQLLKDIALNFELVLIFQFHLIVRKILKHFDLEPLVLSFFELFILHFPKNFGRSSQELSIRIRLCNTIFVLEFMLKFLWGCSKKEEYLNV